MGEPAGLYGTALSLSQYVCGQDGHLQIRHLVIVRGKDQSVWGLLFLSVHLGGCPWYHLGQICTSIASISSRVAREVEKLSVGLETKVSCLQPQLTPAMAVWVAPGMALSTKKPIISE